MHNDMHFSVLNRIGASSLWTKPLRSLSRLEAEYRGHESLYIGLTVVCNRTGLQRVVETHQVSTHGAVSSEALRTPGSRQRAV